MNAWAASEVYVDGNLLNTFGNTGTNGKPFKEFSPIYQLPVPFNIEKGNEHTIAVHFVDFVSPLPPYQLKSEGRFHDFISITHPDSKPPFQLSTFIGPFYSTMLISVNAILCLLFWLLAFQNPAEKNLLLIAATTTAMTLVFYCQTYSSAGMSYFVYRFYALALPIIRSATMILMIVLMLRIFNRKLTLLFKIAACLLFIGGSIQFFFVIML